MAASLRSQNDHGQLTLPDIRVSTADCNSIRPESPPSHYRDDVSSDRQWSRLTHAPIAEHCAIARLGLRNTLESARAAWYLVYDPVDGDRDIRPRRRTERRRRHG